MRKWPGLLSSSGFDCGTEILAKLDATVGQSELRRTRPKDMELCRRNLRGRGEKEVLTCKCDLIAES